MQFKLLFLTYELCQLTAAFRRDDANLKKSSQQASNESKKKLNCGSLLEVNQHQT